MSNKKQKRTDGIIQSSSIKMPASKNSSNTPTSEYSYYRGDHARKTQTPNNFY